MGVRVKQIKVLSNWTAPFLFVSQSELFTFLHGEAHAEDGAAPGDTETDAHHDDCGSRHSGVSF